MEAVFETQKPLYGIPWGTSKGLFTRREGYLSKWVKVGLPYHPGQLYQLC